MIVKAKPLRRDVIKDEILKMIANSGMRAGDRLLSEKKLSEAFGVTHLTVRAALAELEEGRVIERISGSGTFYTGCLAGHADSSKRTRTVAIMMSNAPHFYSGLHYEIGLALQNAGFHVSPYYIHSKQNLPEAEEFLKNFSIDADFLIIDQAEIENDDILFEAFNQYAPKFKRIIRLLGNGCRQCYLPGHQITIDYAAAYNEVIAGLKAIGHRRIAYFGGQCDNSYPAGSANRKFISFYTEAMIANDLSEHITVRNGSDNKLIVEAARELLTMTERPTAILGMNDYRGVILMDCVRELGIKVPEDLSIVGFYDTPWAVHFDMDSLRPRSTELAAEIVRSFQIPAPFTGVTAIPADYIKRNTVQPPGDKT